MDTRTIHINVSCFILSGVKVLNTKLGCLKSVAKILIVELKLKVTVGGT